MEHERECCITDNQPGISLPQRLSKLPSLALRLLTFTPSEGGSQVFPPVRATRCHSLSVAATESNCDFHHRWNYRDAFRIVYFVTERAQRTLNWQMSLPHPVDAVSAQGGILYSSHRERGLESPIDLRELGYNRGNSPAYANLVCEDLARPVDRPTSGCNRARSDCASSNCAVHTASRATSDPTV